MPRRRFIGDLLVAGLFVFSATLSAQTSSIGGNVTSRDGRPLKDGEVRFEQKGGQISPISRTDANGRYTAVLARGVYKMSLTERGAVSASITVRRSEEHTSELQSRSE